jgi:transcriptional regulator with XRE-family HTH domain
MAAHPVPHLLVRARQALGWTQRELGENLGSSQRTATRWESGASHFDAISSARLLGLLYPVNPQLAADLAAVTGNTLVGLGLEAPPAPPAPPPPPVVIGPPALPAPRPAALQDLIDSVVCSVADAGDVSPRTVRPMVLLTLRRALEVGLDVSAAQNAGLLHAEGSAVDAKAEP